ncbi:MAG: hypothetical protein R3E53_15600 [Myxococcota bacterium]
MLPANELVDPQLLVHEMRLFKSEDELALMRQAAAIGCEAHHAAARLAMPGRWDASSGRPRPRLPRPWRRRTGLRLDRRLGRNATILHYIRNDQQLAPASSS